MRKRLAGYLRVLAYLVDGQEFISARWHKTSVEATNNYIGQTERYIVALEVALEQSLGKPFVCKLRQRYKRFDTKPMLDAGVWN